MRTQPTTREDEPEEDPTVLRPFTLPGHSERRLLALPKVVKRPPTPPAVPARPAPPAPPASSDEPPAERTKILVVPTPAGKTASPTVTPRKTKKTEDGTVILQAPDPKTLAAAMQEVARRTATEPGFARAEGVGRVSAPPPPSYVPPYVRPTYSPSVSPPPRTNARPRQAYPGAMRRTTAAATLIVVSVLTSAAIACVHYAHRTSTRATSGPPPLANDAPEKLDSIEPHEAAVVAVPALAVPEALAAPSNPQIVPSSTQPHAPRAIAPSPPPLYTAKYPLAAVGTGAAAPVPRLGAETDRQASVPTPPPSTMARAAGPLVVASTPAAPRPAAPARRTSPAPLEPDTDLAAQLDALGEQQLAR